MGMDSETEETTMSASSATLSARSRKAHSRLLHSLERADEGAIAQRLGIDPSTLSRKKNDKKTSGLTDLELFCGLLDELGLKIVPAEYQSFNRERVNALFELSRGWMMRAESVDDLFQDELGGRHDLEY